MVDGGDPEFKSIVSTSVFDMLDGVLLNVDAEMRPWYVSVMKDAFSAGDERREGTGVGRWVSGSR